MATKKKIKKVVFLGAKNIGYACFKTLINQQAALHYEIIGLISNEQATLAAAHSLTKLAEAHQIPVLAHEDELLKLPSFDLLISVQYHRILKQKHIACAKQLAVNLHMAPLPEYRGCNQFSFALINNETHFGTTLHQMDEGVDSGAILFEKRFKIPEACFVKTLYDKTEKASIALFKAHLKDLLAKNYKAVPQAKLIAKRGTHYYKRSDIQAIKQIDLNWDREKIDRHIRATYFPPYEPPFTLINGTKFYIQPKP